MKVIKGTFDIKPYTGYKTTLKCVSRKNKNSIIDLKLKTKVTFSPTGIKYWDTKHKQNVCFYFDLDANESIKY